MEVPRTGLRGPQLYPNNNDDKSVSVSPSDKSVAQSIGEDGQLWSPQDQCYGQFNKEPLVITFLKIAQLSIRVNQGDLEAQVTLGEMCCEGKGGHS
ncbi:hypothetical protein BGZ89_007482 [Linnemannia elongata]|nr:hypothetical protein BGZ89_007482 [Linnemannia elongata]